MSINESHKVGMMTERRSAQGKQFQLRLSERRMVMIFGDTLIIVIAVFCALAIWATVGNSITFGFGFLLSESVWFFILPSLWLLLAHANGYYEFSTAADRWGSLQRLILINLQLLAIYVLVFFLAQRDVLPRLFILYYVVLSFPLLMLWRIFNPALIGWASTQRRVLIVGTDDATPIIIKTIQDYAQYAYTIVGIVSESPTDRTSVLDIPVMGTSDELLDIIKSEGISEVIVTSKEALNANTLRGVMDAHEYGLAITPMPILYERITERVPVEHVGNNWAVVLPISGTSVFNPYGALKRFADIVLALVGLVIFVLLLPILAIAIYLDSPGSVFYSQIRVGLNGRLFRIYKLRSMKENAEAQTGAVFAQKSDPRVTRVGRFLRKTRLDELPQLWNILKGDMSLIGPRPERPQHVERLQENIPFYRARHIIRPGVTGWAQVRYGYGANDDDALVKLQYDLYYIRHQSLILDLGILIRTVGKVLRMSGQ